MRSLFLKKILSTEKITFFVIGDYGPSYYLVLKNSLAQMVKSAKKLALKILFP